MHKNLICNPHNSRTFLEWWLISDIQSRSKLKIKRQCSIICLSKLSKYIFNFKTTFLVHHHLKMHSSNSRIELIMSNVFGPGFASKNVDRYSSYPTLAQHNIYKAIYTENCARARITYLREDFTMKEKAFLLKAPTSFQLGESPSLLCDCKIFAKVSFELSYIHLIWMMTPGVRFLNCSQMMGER